MGGGVVRRVSLGVAEGALDLDGEHVALGGGVFEDATAEEVVELLGLGGLNHEHPVELVYGGV